MALKNQEIAAILDEIADLLELTGANPFRVRAFRNGARSVRDEARELADAVAAAEDLTALSGIGKDLAALITSLTTTGRADLYDELHASVPAGLLDILKLEGIGPKKARALWQSLNITDLEQLRAAAEAGRIRTLKGFGAKTEANILAAIAATGRERRFRRDEAAPYVSEVLKLLQAVASSAARVDVAGSWRRGKDTVGDLDFLVAGAQDATAVMDAFTGGEDVTEVLARGPTKASVRFRNGLQADLRIVAPSQWGAALLYFTGSQAHNVALRGRAKDRSLKLNEYALTTATGHVVASSDEAEVYAALGLPWIPPELRENRGEIEAAEKNDLPQLITEKDWRGNLHAHSNWSDGRHELAEIVAAARAAGYAYWAITDHSRRLTVANGLDAARLRQQMAEIDKLNAGFSDGFRVFKGIEVDILEDGTLDLDDGILADLDIVIASVHHKFKLPEAQQTERIMRAMDNRTVHMIAHPTGRLLTERPAYAVNVERLIDHAAATGVWLELNASPRRLDLDDHYVRLAAQRGVKIAINTDAHRIRDFAWLAHGIAQARRGWLRAEDVVNTRDAEGVLALRRRS